MLHQWLVGDTTRLLPHRVPPRCPLPTVLSSERGTIARPLDQHLAEYTEKEKQLLLYFTLTLT